MAVQRELGRRRLGLDRQLLSALVEEGVSRDAVVVAIVLGDRLVVPGGDTTLQSGDEVLVLVTAEAEHAVHALFIADAER